ncbi:protein kinase domain-containing protein [Nocardia carnea]|uniref:protein kinase domain-containing protein n=1 Tax=Nocardia carnea TaxID=37328 RepID=UPI00245487A2|nr:protein kinase [Nocardia carnea]
MSKDRLIAGRYRLTDPIGTGAMGVVWRALDIRLQRTVAVKQVLLGPNLTEQQTAEARKRALREGRIAARLHHPNAISVFDVADEDGQPWLVMEYMNAPSLANRLNLDGTLAPLKVAELGAQAAGAPAPPPPRRKRGPARDRAGRVWPWRRAWAAEPSSWRTARYRPVPVPVRRPLLPA